MHKRKGPTDGGHDGKACLKKLHAGPHNAAGQTQRHWICRLSQQLLLKDEGGQSVWRRSRGCGRFGGGDGGRGGSVSPGPRRMASLGKGLAGDWLGHHVRGGRHPRAGPRLAYAARRAPSIGATNLRADPRPPALRGGSLRSRFPRGLGKGRACCALIGLGGAAAPAPQRPHPWQRGRGGRRGRKLARMRSRWCPGKSGRVRPARCGGGSRLR